MILKLLKQVTQSLNENKIPYMLSGSVAMNIYTIPRMTRDIDIVINLKLEDIEMFAKIFKDGFYLYKEGIETEIKRRGMFNVIDFDSGLKIDFIIRKNTNFHINEFARKKCVSNFGFPIFVVSIEDLIISKLIWIQQLQSDTQIRDIKNLLSNQEIDIKEILHWSKELDLKTFNLLK